MLGEKGAPFAVSGKVAFPGTAIVPRQLSERREVFREAFELRIDDWIWPVSRQHTCVPTALADSAVMLQRVERAFGGRQNLDAVAIEQGTRAESSRASASVMVS